MAEIVLFSNEKARKSALAEQALKLIFHDNIPAEFPKAMAHYDKLCQHEAFAPDVVPYLEKLQKHIDKNS